MKKEENAVMEYGNSSITHKISQIITLFHATYSRSHRNITVSFGLSISKTLSIKWSNYFEDINWIKI